MKYKKCDKCLAHYPNKKGYIHECDPLMKFLVTSCKTRNKEYNKNKKQLASFTAYCKKYPEQRFWQALRNWSKYNFIYGGQGLTSDKNLEDTFFKE